ncbi:MAG: hypothetical protein ACQES8_05905 [Thermodesulfobacteriota bacterium]
MKLIFLCPDKNQVFESAAYRLIENHGIVENRSGEKYLDAKVELMESCPYCGQTHIFHANELMCPLTGAD